MDQKSADEYQFRMAIEAAKNYFVMYRTSQILCGQPPKKIGMSLIPAISLGLYVW